MAYPDIKALYQNDFDAYDYVKQFLGPTKAALSSQSDGKSGTHTTNLSHGTSAKSFDSNLRIAISRMNISITEVDQRIQDLVTQHAGDFLERIDQVDTLQESLSVTRKNMAALHQQASEYVYYPLTYQRTRTCTSSTFNNSNTTSPVRTASRARRDHCAIKASDGNYITYISTQRCST